MTMMKGTGASPGIAYGKVLIIKEEKAVVEKRDILDIAGEITKIKDALEVSKEELSKIRDKVKREIGEEESEIFTAHLMILEDPELIDSSIKKVEDEKICGEFALRSTADMFINMLNAMDNEYMRERAKDIDDVVKRIISHIMGIKMVDLASLDQETILVAEDLTPSQTAVMDKKMVKGFLTDIGGRTSHSAIMARTLGIPAVVGLGDITSAMEDGTVVAFDGEVGEVHISPDEALLNRFKEEEIAYREKIAELQKYKGEKSITLDGREVEVACNIGTPNDIQGVIENDGEGIGLYRTEFLYMDNSSLPTEEEQFEAYKKVIEGMNGKPVVIRTLDIGGDKELDYMKLPHEMNPFLGYRAIRICLEETGIFKTQLRALLRASIYGKLRIMFPMISSLQELLAAKAVLKECREELEAEGVEVDEVGVGMMIEVPSAAIISDILAKEVDFFSIGTNDLTQYTTAVDRMNQKIHKLYDTFNPGVIRLIDMVIKNAHKEGKWVGMCGEAAGDELMIPLLLGLGLDEFSMSAGSVLKARKQICNENLERCSELSQKVLTLGSSDEIKAAIKKHMES